MKKVKKKSILTRKEAANLLSVSLPTLKAWTDQKILQSYKLGGRIYYIENEIIGSLERV
ncbi:MAG: excisionase [Bacteroidetes bacterium]|nr:MAG: excisionase [Bacteroidota bacterium]